MIINLLVLGIVIIVLGIIGVIWANAGIIRMCQRLPDNPGVPKLNKSPCVPLLRISHLIVVSGVLLIFLYMSGLRVNLFVQWESFWFLFFFLLFPLLLLIIWGSKDGRIKDFLINYKWVFLAMVVLIITGPKILKEAKEFQLGKEGVKVVMYEQVKIQGSIISKEYSLSPRVQLKNILPSFNGERPKQDISFFRFQAYLHEAKLFADLFSNRQLLNSIVNTPKDDGTSASTSDRLKWASELHNETKTLTPKIREIAEDHLHIWEKIKHYEEFVEYVKSKNEMADEILDKLRSGQEDQAIIDTKKLGIEIEKTGNKFTDIPYFYTFLARIYGALKEDEKALKYIYDGFILMPNDMNINSILADYVWPLHGNAIQASEHKKRALGVAERNLKEVKDNIADARDLLKKTEQKVKDKQNKIIISQEKKTLEKYKEDHQQELLERFSAAQIAFKNGIAYFLAQEGIEEEIARKYSEEVYKKKPEDPYYIDTYAFVLTKFNRDETEIKKALLLFGEAENRAWQAPRDFEDLLKILSLHFQIAEEELSRSKKK